MRVGNGLQLASISASWTKKEFKLRTVYSRFSQQKKPVREFKFKPKFEHLQVVWQSLPMAIPEDHWRVWLQNQWLSSWGSAPAQLGLARRASTAKHKDRAFPSLLQWLWPRQARLRKKVLAHLQYWHSSRVKKVSFFGAWQQILISYDMKFPMKFARLCYRPKQRSLLCSIFQSFVGLLVKIGHWNESACSYLNPVQSSRSKLAT